MYFPRRRHEQISPSARGCFGFHRRATGSADPGPGRKRQRHQQRQRPERADGGHPPAGSRQAGSRVQRLTRGRISCRLGLVRQRGEKLERRWQLCVFRLPARRGPGDCLRQRRQRLCGGIAYNPDNVPGSLGRDGSVFLTKSNDDGHSFRTIQKIVFAGSGTASYCDKPWLHVNRANNDVNLVWVRRSNAWHIGGTEAMTIEFARSVDGGATFSAPVQVSTFSPATGTSSSHGPQVVSGSGQKIFVAWHSLEAGDPRIAGWVPPKIWIAESNDAGASFGTNYLVVPRRDPAAQSFEPLHQPRD